MRAATAITSRPATPRFAGPEETTIGQVPLPFPGTPPVLPVPLERAGPGPSARVLRASSARFMQALTEVLSGERPARQMAAWMTPDVYTQLSARLVLRARLPRRAGVGTGARIASVHLSAVSEEAVEVAGRMVHRGRSRALAVRLELTRTHRGERVWMCTALEWA